jgi:predicted nucleic acid-binding protein
VPSPQIVLDANVIVQALVRDLLLDADAYGLCRVRWTEAILVEARRTLIEDFGRDPARIDALLAAMRFHFPRAAIVGYEERIAAMANDPKDRHVAAAAVWAGADIATFNLRHFRPAALAPFAVRTLHPDAFLMELYSAYPDTLAAIVRAQAAQRRDPPLALAAYLDKLIAPLPRFAAAIRVRAIAAP